MGVKYRKPNYEYIYKYRAQVEIRTRQQEFAYGLASMIRNDDHEIVYVDEASFNLWQRPSRSWLRREQALMIPLNRGPSITVFAGLSQAGCLVHYSIVNGSNNAETFANFIDGLQKKMPHCVVIMDNLAVHKSKKVIEIFKEGFRQQFLPPYSS